MNKALFILSRPKNRTLKGADNTGGRSSITLTLIPRPLGWGLLKGFIIICALVLINPLFVFAKDASPVDDLLPHLLFFYSQSCHACHKTRTEVMPAIEKEFSGTVIIEYMDIGDIDNYKMMLALKQKYNCLRDGVPTVFIQGKIFVGSDQIKAQLRDTIVQALKKGVFAEFDKLPGVDLVKRFLSFGALAIIVAGLIDGINPCAFTVIVFFISFLAFQGYRKRELLAIGITFILAVFLTYVLVGLGIFRFLYSLRHFYLVTKAIYYCIALFCFVLGGFAVYDLWVYKKTKKTEGMALQLPQAVKNKIHSIIGLHYRKSKAESSSGIPERHFLRLIGSAFITGFLVSLLEAVCTGQLYLPTITFMLKNVSLRGRAFAYLLLYNIMFIIPLSIVLVFALLGTTSEGFSAFLKKHMLAVKISMVLLFFGLGVLILLGV